MRGRKPTIATLTMPANDKPKAPVKIPRCPDALKGEAALEWKRITALLHRLGVIAQLDRSALAIYCMAWARWVDAENQLAQQGAVVKSPNGYPIQNPYLSISNQAAKQIQVLLSEFGLSPAARHRMLGAPKKKTKAAATGWEGVLANVG